MQLATIRVSGGTRAVRIDGGRAVETGHSDVGALLAVADWRDQAAGAGGEQHPASSLGLAPVVPRPGKVVCVGLNYRNHGFTAAIRAAAGRGPEVCQIRTLRPPHGVPAWCRSGGTVRVTREEPCALPSTTATTS